MPFTPPGGCPVDLHPDGHVTALGPLTWTGTRGDTVRIPTGRTSDLGTVPQPVRAVLPHDGPAARAFLVHDELCARLHTGTAGAWTARDADHALRLILRELGTSPIAARLYWTGSRWGALRRASRRAGWWRDAPAVAAWSLIALIILTPPAVGALLGRALLAVCELTARPFTRTRPDLPGPPRYGTPRRPAPAACPEDGELCASTCGARPDCAADARSRAGNAPTDLSRPAQPSDPAQEDPR